MQKLTFADLTKILDDSRLFELADCERISKACGVASVGNAVIACQLLGIELYGSDVDALFASYIDFVYGDES